MAAIERQDIKKTRATKEQRETGRSLGRHGIDMSMVPFDYTFYETCFYQI
jgi:hypothetical protein